MTNFCLSLPGYGTATYKIDSVVCTCLHVCGTNPITWSRQEMLLVPCKQPFEQLKSVQLLYQEDEEEEDEDEYTDEIALL